MLFSDRCRTYLAINVESGGDCAEKRTFRLVFGPRALACWHVVYPARTCTGARVRGGPGPSRPTATRPPPSLRSLSTTACRRRQAHRARHGRRFSRRALVRLVSRALNMCITRSKSLASNAQCSVRKFRPDGPCPQAVHDAVGGRERDVVGGRLREYIPRGAFLMSALTPDISMQMQTFGK